MPPATCNLPLPGRLMSLDVGDKRVGVAVSDEMQLFAAPVTVLTRRSRAEDAARLGNIASERAVVGLVVGLPLHADGSESSQARLAARYGHRMANALELPVVLWNEHGSTQEAAELLQQAGRRGSSPGLDAEAAAVILQDYLDAQQSSVDANPPGGFASEGANAAV